MTSSLEPPRHISTLPFSEGQQHRPKFGNERQEWSVANLGCVAVADQVDGLLWVK